MLENNTTLHIQGKRILIIGNRSYRNLGDELILIGTIKILQSQGKKIYIQAYDASWLKGFLKQFVDVSTVTFLTEIPKGVRSWAKFLWNEIYKGKLIELWHYARIESVIVGGGEILTEENPNSYRYRLISLLPCLMRKIFVKTNIYLMGGIQIPKKNLNVKLFDFLLSKTSYIYARDPHSVEALKAHGFKDVEFFMDTAYYAWERENISKPSPLTPLPHSERGNVPYIIVNINKNAEQFLDEVIADVHEYMAQGYAVYYCPVSKGKNPEYNDMKYLRLLQHYPPLTPPGNKEGNKIHILDWEKDFGKFVEMIKGAEVVISTRLHLFLVAEFLGVKVKVYPYQRKVLKMKEVVERILR